MHLPPLISDLAMMLGVAAVVTFLFQKIRQPVVLGYLLAGVIVGPYTPTGLSVSDLPSVKVWAELGVIFLMFSLGLEFTFHKLARVGVTAGVTGIVEVVLMVTLGYWAGWLLGWSKIDSLFLGGILSISSTTIIIKAFDELGMKTRRFAELVFGVLIVEDLVAILLLVAFATIATTQTFFSWDLVLAAAELLAIVGSWFVVGYFFIPKFLRYAGRFMSNETLTVLSTSMCLFLVVVATHFEYSAALGAFIMGSILAETSESHRIETLVLPLKDLFAAIFFVSVGMLVDPKILMENAKPIAFITILTIVGKIVSSTIGALMTGQPLRRSVQIGFSLAQIGEFSFIIATLGSTLKVTSDFLYPVAVSVSVITTFITPYLIRFSDPAAERLEKLLPKRLTRRIEEYSSWMQRPRAHGSKWTALTGHLLAYLRKGKEDPELSALAPPWDVHLVKLHLHQNSTLTGKTLLEQKIREKYGLNIVAIQRGAKVIASPKATDVLFPQDQLLVLGTDLEIERFRPVVETPSGDTGGGKALSEYFLRGVLVEDGSPFIGHSLREAGIREKLQGLVVGLERASSRSINPDPNTVLKPGDLLWVVTEPA